MKLPIKPFLNRIACLNSNFFSNKRFKLSYVVEDKDWVVRYVGNKIIGGLKKAGFNQARISISSWGLRNQIIHFGSLHTFLTQGGFQKFHFSNRAVLSWFHFVPENNRNQNILKAQKYLNFIHTSCAITKNKLVGFGVNPAKIVVIPLGVDLSLFKPSSQEEKEQLRNSLGIPKESIIIGSFQKDGVGWGKGLEPKLIKGPDIFVEAVRRLSKDYPIFVLLVGPARGYVKMNLEKKNIPYKSIGYLKDFTEVAKYYRALDLYLVTSRIEGGPEAVVESLASGVPLISTKVGMAPDIIIDGQEAFLTEVENVDQIVQKAQTIIDSPSMKESLVQNGLKKVQDYSWEKIAQQYYQKMYSKMGL